MGPIFYNEFQKEYSLLNFEFACFSLKKQQQNVIFRILKKGHKHQLSS